MARVLFGALFVFSMVLSLLFQVGEAKGCTVTIGGTGYASIQAAVNAAVPGDTVSVNGVAGACNENVLIGNDKVKVFLVGSGGATINGPDTSSSTLEIRGKAIFIQGFIVSGGADGIRVQREGNAVIDNNVVDGAGADGIQVGPSAFAVITNNTIQNNGARGIQVQEGASAHIGYNEGNMPAGPNTIQNNAGDGVRIIRSSAARITTNVISNNGGNGIRVFEAAQADIANNDIDSNTSDGILVQQNSSVQLGDQTGGVGLFLLPNRTTTNNGGFGLRCNLGAAVDGIIGTLNGAGGQTSIAGNCPNGTVP